MSILVIIGLLVVGWPPLLYRRFSRGGQTQPVMRTAICGFGFWLLAVMIADLTFRLPYGWVYPLLVLALPVPLNILAWCKYVFRSKKGVS